MPDVTHDTALAEHDDRPVSIRNRVMAIVAVEFTMLMAVAAIEGFWPGAGPGPIGATAFLVASMILVPVALATLTRPILRDIHRLGEENARLRDLYSRARDDSLIDALTGLGNHRAFQEELVRQLEHAGRTGANLSLMLIDVDDLKKVNDEHGHAVGDQLLAAVGWTAMATLRRNDRAFRVGGDEFAVILPGTDLQTGLAVARRILAAGLNGGNPTHPIEPFSMSIGVSAFPTPSAKGSLLYRHADAALYWCKRHGRTSAVSYDPHHHGIAPDERSVEDVTAAIETILARRTLRPVYQPIFSLETGEPLGFEGLIRTTDSSPITDTSALFVAAERADRTVELDMACLEVIAAGAADLAPASYLSINLSPRTLESDLFQPADVTGIFARYGIAPNRLVIEITERETVEDLAMLRRNAAACRKAGVRLAADDVGAGNAGLRLLSEIHFDIVKIDLSLVQGGIQHDPSQAVLGALQELATRWSATIVAEGVETAEQLAAIRGIGIKTGQGYLLGRPSSDLQVEPLDIGALLPDGFLSRAQLSAA